jgi:hypothetical protein
MSHKGVLVLLLLGVLIAPVAWSQTNTNPWPANGPVAVGTTTPTAGAKMDIDSCIRLVGEGYPAAAASGDPGAWLINEVGVGFALQAGGSIRLRTGATTTDRLTINTAGNVGIGAASADAKLQVAGGSAFISGDSGALTTNAGAGLALKYYNGNALVFGYDYTNSTFKNLALQSPGGNVTVGMVGNLASPSTNARLIVYQGDNATGLAIGNYSGVGRLALNGNSDGSWTAYDNFTGSWSPGITQRAGNVGIGRSTPQYPLDVNGRIQSSVMPPNGTTEAIAGLHLSSRGPNGAPYMWGFFSSSNYNPSGASPNGLDLWEYPDNAQPSCCIPRIQIRRATSYPQTFMIDGAGHVGIGVTPGAGYSLDVAGAIHATQVIGATYQDVAEWVPATTKMSPGTVVVVQRGAKNTVMPSGAAYATSVAGVVSEKPGVILGESSESKAMIATTGRVRVHVDASKGAIEAGDLLVTSDKPGMAMKSQPVDLGGVKIHRPGTLIGKALESLSNGEGDILVLLSLQ